MQPSDDLVRFEPVADPRPDDDPWPPMIWPVPDGAVLAGEVVQLSALDPAADAGKLMAVLDDDRVWAHVPGRPVGLGQLRQTLGRLCSLDDWHLWVVRTRRAIGGLPAGTLVGVTAYLDAHPRDAWLEVGLTLYNPAVWATAVNPEAKLLLLG
ncbi:MAG TPA: N-acetyltransferase, partial [Mycobacterium sp.]|nr:N-acetyltransferase [Mycobacterium sp.]